MSKHLFAEALKKTNMTTMTLPPDNCALNALARTLVDTLRARGSRVTTAESCTGGWIAKMITDLPGSSEIFDVGVVTYSNAAKQSLLGVSTETLVRHGAVSRECAAEMVSGALARYGAEIAVAVTGIAGPTGGTPDKPIGTVWIGWQRREGEIVTELFHFDGDREAVRRRTVAAALEGLLKHIAP